MKRKTTRQPRSRPSSRMAETETIEHDDLCAICHCLMLRPVTTTCNHTLCAECMKVWSDISITDQRQIVGLEDVPTTCLPSEMESRCPMCRTLTTASPDRTREAALRRKYKHSYAARELEAQIVSDEHNADTIETLTLYIGNTHHLVKADQSGSKNTHNWKFFVRPSRTDLIEEVQVFLHPTFRNPRVILQLPPYEIHRLGWGFFTIYANVILKAGYRWMSSEAEDTADGQRQGKLPLEWTLDFNSNAGRGSQGRWRLKVKKEKQGQEVEDAVQRESVLRMWRQQRERDPDYVGHESS
ncbi:uncharacterized protein HMPREF1541_00749 [Cyphellophora europaea CBS 101466]|uniref:Protein AF-9 homolog n=1 Tax=Cyphellophora europaea (strain CBS 101466) TaxID=1220924 RepID=W2SF85_CYPE1|nr:uncharacterized protein HMPREF1541_00749 [Cyphellophora europaea CBS 101466]ETN46564.1 hypothetical protein HMPREF1541_00749 [Cyphellophora europaea CBS 101466]